MKGLVFLAGLVLLLPIAVQAGLPEPFGSILGETAMIADPGERGARLSASFLGTPYLPHTLGGGPDSPEQLTVRFDAVDCFTFIDYVEALRRSAGPGEFPGHLTEVRYQKGRIAWETRRHFFTDWVAEGDGRVIDVTASLGGSRVRQVHKELNRRGDGGLYLPGVAVRPRTMAYIPAGTLDQALLDKLRPGDYLGIYSADPGLDVSHVGIVIRAGGRLLLRHASTRRDAGRVVDSDLAGYLRDKPGIVLFRPR